MNFPQLGAFTSTERSAVVFVLVSFVVVLVVFTEILSVRSKKRTLSRLTSFGLDMLAAAAILVQFVAILALFNQPKGAAFEQYNAAVIKYMDKSYGLTFTKAETWKLIDRKPAVGTNAAGENEKVRLSMVKGEDPELIGENLATIPKLTKKAD